MDAHAHVLACGLPHDEYRRHKSVVPHHGSQRADRRWPRLRTLLLHARFSFSALRSKTHRHAHQANHALDHISWSTAARRTSGCRAPAAQSAKLCARRVTFFNASRRLQYYTATFSVLYGIATHAPDMLQSHRHCPECPLIHLALESYAAYPHHSFCQFGVHARRRTLCISDATVP